MTRSFQLGVTDSQMTGTAGLGHGQNDPRAGVLQHILKYIETKVPTTFVLENVGGLRSRKHRHPDSTYVHLESYRCSARHLI